MYYGGYYPPIPVRPNTSEVEQYILDNGATAFSFNYIGDQYGGIDFYWSTRTYPGLNVKFYMYTPITYQDPYDYQFYGWMYEIHVKWENRTVDLPPKAISLKDPNGAPLPNVRDDQHPYLWKLCLRVARQYWLEMNGWIPAPGQQITAGLINGLVVGHTALDDLALEILYTSPDYPLETWDQDAWSAMLDWLTG